MTPPPQAETGGLANAIFGSLAMVTMATLLGTPIGILAGIYLAEYGQRGWLGSATRFINDILLSAPSIVIGLFIYAVVVARARSFSGWAGVLALALIVIPVVIRTTENMLSLIPNALREAAYALGTPKWRVITTVTLRAARAGVITGILLAFARIAGETAPLLFTALSNQFWTSDLAQPMASLPVTIFKFAMSPYENWQQLAWAGVFLITLGRLDSERRRPHVLPQPDLTESRMDARTEIPAVIAAPKLSVRNLNFYYGGFHALKNITLDIPEKKVTSFIGPSGCGKSTLLRTFNRMYELYPGAARRGRDPDGRQQPADVEGRRLPDPRQDRHGVPEADAVPDVDLRQHRLRREAVRVAAAHRDGRAGRMGAAQGGAVGRGEGQARARAARGSRAASSSACASPAASRSGPEVLLLDEPCSALDPISTGKIEELIHELKTDYTVVIVTHNMQQAARCSDFTAYMYLGDLIEFGRTNDVFMRPKKKDTEDYITGRFG